MRKEYAQGRRARRISTLRHVSKRPFQASFRDRIAGRPPPRFDTFWYYEHDRGLANGALARGIDPTGLSRAEQAELLRDLVLDGTIV
jgi:hypothetical protein